MKFDEVMGRVASFIQGDIGVTPLDKEIAFALGINSTTYATIKKRQSIPYPQILHYCKENHIDGNMIFFNKKCNVDIVRIPFCRDSKEKLVSPHVNTMALSSVYLQTLGVKNFEDVACTTIKDDSMGDLFKRGTTVVVDKTRLNFLLGGVFAVTFRQREGVFVRRLIANPHGGISVITDDRTYPNEDISEYDMTVIGKVVASLRKI